ncbi:MAG: dephospho-CoA kinase [Cyclobacteriaceae bacterium]|nr:dephospho-CoA kinase [Cyclobacteriaceae bacterium]MDW8330698.1 dephospho-CoA kinase [Cyclobacteriaceae bacterium]
MTPLQIGITGGIGSGKSTVCRIFRALGIPVYDADSRAKVVMTSDVILIGRIKQEFGSLAFKEDGTLNTVYLAETVFGDEQRLRVLNSLVHPAVASDYENWLQTQLGKPYIIKEAALLFESGSYRNLDYTVLVVAPVEVRLRRVLQRDPFRTEKQIRDIMARQLPEDEAKKLARCIIQNDDVHPVLPQVLALHQQWLTGNIQQI